MSLATLRFTDVVTCYRETLGTTDAATLLASACGCENDASQGEFAVRAPEAEAGTVTWNGVLTVENEVTGDGRMLESNSLRWENLPLALRYAPVDTGGHQGAQVVGRILTITRQSDGKIAATGDFDMQSPLGPEAARVVKEGTENGVSVDLDSVSFEIRIAKELLQDINDDLAEDPPQLEAEKPGEDEEGRITVVEINADDEVMVTTDARIRAATIVSIPAFIGASIDLDDPEVDLDAAAAGVVEEAEAIAASAAGVVPVDPPAAWFENPNLSGPTPITITSDGRVFGHIAAWDSCHTGYPGQCVSPPRSPSGYAYFRTGAILTAEGREIAVGGLTIDTLHAGRTLSAADTLAHYENTGRRAADVAAGEDEFGIWVAGAIRPSIKGEKLRSLRAAPMSGDWRKIGGNLELVAALGVNSPGFPVPRAQGLVASGSMVSLVASGMLAPGAEPPVLQLSEEEVEWVRQRTAQEMRAKREEQEGIQTEAEALASRVRSTAADALARRAGVR